MHMTILDQMGIQVWRLRKSYATPVRSSSQTVADASLSEGTKVVPDPTTQASSIASANLTSDANLTAATEIESALESTQGPSNNSGLLNHSVAPNWSALEKAIGSTSLCQSCGPQNSVLGSGSQTADWFFLSDAPNSREVASQIMFDGRSGQLFDAILLALGIDRESVYCSSIFKCAPTQDLSHMPSCGDLVYQQLELIKPSLLIAFGEFSAQTLLKSNEPLLQLREHEQACVQTQTRVIPTYSLRDMLDDPSLKAYVWSDLKKALDRE